MAFGAGEQAKIAKPTTEKRSPKRVLIDSSKALS